MEFETESFDPTARSRSPLAALRRFWPAIVVATLVFAVGAYGYMSRKASVYRSTSQVQITNPSAVAVLEERGSDRTERVIETQVQVITSSRVRQVAEAKLEALGHSSGVGRLAVTPVPDTGLLNMSVSHSSPTRAQAANAAVVDAYLEEFRRRALEQLAPAKSQLEDKAAERSAVIGDLDRAIAIEGSVSPGADALIEERSRARDQLASYQSQLDLIDIGVRAQSDAIKLVEPASVPSSSVSPKPARSAVLAAGVGAALAAGAAVLFTHFDDAIRSRSEAAAALGLPPLGVIPRLRRGRRRDRVHLELLKRPAAPGLEPFRALRTRLLSSERFRGGTVVMVTSPGPGEGKSFTATMLAVVAAQAGQSVVLVDGDLRRPRIHRYTGLRNDRGLTTALRSRQPLIDDLLRPPRWESRTEELRVLTSGPVPQNPAEVLGLAQLGHFFKTLRAWSDLVVVDSSPLVPVTDAAVLASHCDGVLVVVRERATTYTATRYAIEELESVGANVLGFVLNDATRSSDMPKEYFSAEYSTSISTSLGPHRNGRNGRNGRASRGPVETPSRGSVLLGRLPMEGRPGTERRPGG